MKKILCLFIVCMIFANINLKAQQAPLTDCSNPTCTASSTCAENPERPGFGMMCPNDEELPHATVGVPYNQSITIIAPQKAEIAGTPINVIKSIVIEDVSNLPNGMSACRNSPHIVSGPANRKCCLLWGTPNVAPGMHRISLRIQGYLSETPSALTKIPNGLIDTAIYLTVVPKPVPAFTAPLNAIVGDPIQFTNTSQYAVSYSWDFGDDSGISNEVNPTHTYSTSGTFTVILKAKNSADYEETTNKVITIIPIGVESTTILDKVSIYPNPAENEITVTAEDVESITILDVRGMVVSYVQSNSKETKIDVSHLPKANYIVKVKIKDKMVTKSLLLQ